MSDIAVYFLMKGFHKTLSDMTKVAQRKQGKENDFLWISYLSPTNF